MAVLTVSQSVVDRALTTVAAATGDQFPNDGAVVLYVKNAGVSSRTITLTPGGPVVGLALTPVTVVVGVGQERVIGPFEPLYWNDANGMVNIGYSSLLGVTVAALRTAPEPNGTWPIFAPDLLPSLGLWLDATALPTLFQDSAGATPVTATGQTVARWNSVAGSTFANNATAGAQPTYRTAQQRNQAAVDFDGTDYLDSLYTPAGSELTILVAGKTNATVGVQRGLVTTRGSATAGARVLITSGNFVQSNVFDGTSTPTNNSAATLAANTAYIIGGRFSATANDVIFNDVIKTSAHALTYTHGTVDISRANINQTTTLYSGLLFEVLVWNQALTDALLQQAIAYLNGRWSIF